ncbi:unnamed protein product [Paramecium primaurelia]|uniref:Uncharacterized protein n=1 Tax=Paramecium primaurelia TaxID=5886 RepID=A0A8S1N3Q8_PARPR|nr:unnamed protein product [Paramecium primaurelia]
MAQVTNQIRDGFNEWVLFIWHNYNYEVRGGVCSPINVNQQDIIMMTLEIKSMQYIDNGEIDDINHWIQQLQKKKNKGLLFEKLVFMLINCLFGQTQNGIIIPIFITS